MRALSLWQPWATLVIAGAKPYEWRTYPAPRFVRGTRIVIHAAKRPMKRADLIALLEDFDNGDGDTTLIADIARPILERAHLGLPLGAGLGTVMLGRPKRAVEMFPDDPRVDPDKWAWPMSAPEPFKPVIPARGERGFFWWTG